VGRVISYHLIHFGVWGTEDRGPKRQQSSTSVSGRRKEGIGPGGGQTVRRPSKDSVGAVDRPKVASRDVQDCSERIDYSCQQATAMSISEPT
jgi:hypothetical protein